MVPADIQCIHLKEIEAVVGDFARSEFFREYFTTWEVFVANFEAELTINDKGKVKVRSRGKMFDFQLFVGRYVALN